MKSKHAELYAILVPTVLAALIAVLFAASGSIYLRSPAGNIPTSEGYLMLIPLNVSGNNLYGASFEVVTTIIWDHRGIDTYYETAVLFVAIVAALAIGGEKILTIAEGGKEYTLIVRTVVKVMIPLIIAVSLSVALHGHLTPGGGFQGGSIFGVAPLLAVLAFGTEALKRLKARIGGLLTLRVLGVVSIAFIALGPVLISAIKYLDALYVFLNQPKAWTELGYPAVIPTPWGNILLSGTLFWLNVSEFIAVSTGFFLAFVYLENYLSSKSVGGKQ